MASRMQPAQVPKVGVLGERWQRNRETVALQELEESGGLAAGDDQAVEPGELFGSRTSTARRRLPQGSGVRRVVALDGEDADEFRTCCHSGPNAAVRR